MRAKSRFTIRPDRQQRKEGSRRKKTPENRRKRARYPRDIDPRAIKVVEDLDKLIETAVENDLTVTISRVAGRGNKPDGWHTQLRWQGLVIADWWPSCGKLLLAGKRHVVDDACDVVPLVASELLQAK